MNRLGLVLLLPTLTMGFACGSKSDPDAGADGSAEGSTSGGSDSGDSDSGESTGSEGYEGAECFELSISDTEYGDEYWRVVDTCNTLEPCARLSIDCSGDGEEIDCDVEGGVLAEPAEAEVLTCVLETLAGGDDALVEWSYTDATLPGYARRSHELWVIDGRWFHASESFVDLSGAFEGFREVEPLTTESLQACLAAEDEPSRLACLADPATRAIGEVFPAQ